MRTFLLLFLLVLSINHLAAQKVETAKDLLKINKLAEAKKEIDAFLTQENNLKNPEAWYTKAKIYNAISLSPALSKQVPDARMQAFLALKKYTEIDDRMLILLQVDGYKPINDIYTAYYQEAANSFNAKQYDKALEGFKNSITVSRFMTDKGWINLKLDTNSVLYAGVAAEKLNRTDDAVKYYSMLADARVKGEGFAEIYKWVANHYFEKKNAALAAKYSTIGRELYPAEPFWNSLELDMAREKANKDELFALYEKTIAAEPANYLYPYNYAVELYQQGYNADVTKRPVNSAGLIDKAEAQVLQAVRLKADYSRAQLFAAQIKYNKGVDLLNESRALKKAGGNNEQKSNDLKTQALQKFDEAIPFFLAVERLLQSQTTLNEEDKTNLKETYDLLITIYDQKGMKDKTKEYETKFNSVNKK